MKKIYLFILMMLIMPLSVSASNKIYNISIDVNVDKYGNANITEVWDVDGSDGTEWYKVLNNLGNSELSNFTVSMDGQELIYKNWNVNESLYQKRGYYGINYTGSGLELCFGKYDYNRHQFTINYTLSNFVFNTDDSQVIYFNFIDRLSSVSFDNFNLTLSSYYEFPSSLDVWGYGYKGYAYVSDGKIMMSNEESSSMDGNYVVLLAKFPLNTFDTVNSYTQYNNFDSVYDKAEYGTFDYDYDTNNGDTDYFSFFDTLFSLLQAVFIFLILGFSIKTALNKGYGYINNKVIDKKNVPMFRDIPCNKDIYYANVLIKLNNFGYKEGNILGAIILKWVRDNKVVFKNTTSGIFNKETSVIDLTNNVTFDNSNEEKLFNMMRAASKDGLLEAKEFEKWCRKNYSKFFDLVNEMVDNKISVLKTIGHIFPRANKSECKKKNVMSDKLYNDSVELYGLKLYLEEFSRMNTKEVMEVKLWDEYLMFAYLFGIADKVSKQLKDMYPEVLEQANYDYDTLIFVNHISTRGVSAASSARSAAQSYSAGGGGFSSGGGGGGSFGGGGGGSR